MTREQALDFGWIVAAPVVGFLGFVAVFLLGLALFREMTR